MSEMPRAYLRMSPNLDQHPDPLGMVMLMCAAARQPERGRFRERSVLERIVGRRRLRAMLTREDVVALDDGRLYVKWWDEWQEGDLTVAERMRRLRARKRDAGVTGPSPRRNDVTTSRLGIPTELDVGSSGDDVGVSVETRAPSVNDPADRLYLRLGTYPSTKLLSWLDDLAAEAGGDATLACLIDATPHDGRDPKAYLEHVRDLIRAGRRTSEKAESEAEAQRARAHREELARRQLDELRAQPATPSAPFSALVPRPGTQEAPR